MRQFTNADFQQLVDIEDAEGDPNKLLDKLLTEKGRREKVYDQAKRKRESFIRASANIGSLVDQIIKEKKFDDIEVDKITKLIKKLKAFKKEVISQ